MFTCTAIPQLAILLLARSHIALTLLPPSPDPIALQPSPSNSALLPDLENNNARNLTSNSTLSYDHPLTNINAIPFCSGARFGYNISRRSCDNALRSIPTFPDDRLLLFGQRGSASWPNNLPARWLSNDGYCAIDLVHKAGANNDSIRVSRFVNAASSVINQCIRGGRPNEGGIVGELGELCLFLYMNMVCSGSNLSCSENRCKRRPRHCRS